ncbi:MAG: hypothetical protein WKF91_03190, partial [Segetibacter sp.]
QQYVDGEKTARVFKELKLTNDGAEIIPDASSGLSAQPENIGTGVSGENAETLTGNNQAVQDGVEVRSDVAQPISGITTNEQQKVIKDRRSKTSLSERQIKLNALLQDIDKYHSLARGRLGRNQSAGLA